MSPPTHPPADLFAVLEHAVDSVLCGGAGYFRVPAGGYLNATWLTRKGCYRVTIDLTAGHELALDDAREWLAELAAKRPPVPASGPASEEPSRG